ncbi:MAG TPA: XdhC family protein [Chthoniobacterales bacterium]|nr:XdhC family protein [Chthoniobacterales bacterium]
MFDEFLTRARALRSEERPFAMAFVVRYQPPVSGKPGDKAIIEADGTIWGWVGGGCVQPLVVREALKAIQDGKPRFVRVAPSRTLESEEGTINYTMTCHSGGALDIYIEPVLSKPEILIIGRSPVAQTLCSLGKAIGYRITVVAAGARKESFPDADITAEALDVQHMPITPETYIVISTQGEQDEEALEKASHTDASYISFVASEAKARKVFSFLAEKGIPRDRLSRIRAPAGLDLGSLSPEEIALSILAEIVQVRKTKTASAERKEMADGKSGKLEAKDPVCGMTVAEGEAKYISEYRGETYYFCCAGCKQEFDRQPEAYMNSAVSNL